MSSMQIKQITAAGLEGGQLPGRAGGPIQLDTAQLHVLRHLLPALLIKPAHSQGDTSRVGWLELCFRRQQSLLCHCLRASRSQVYRLQLRRCG